MPVQIELPQDQLDNVLRLIFTANRERVTALRNASYYALRRLGVRRRSRAEAATKMPEGSDHCDMMSVFVWMNKVQPTDREAVAQIALIDATAATRLGG